MIFLLCLPNQRGAVYNKILILATANILFFNFFYDKCKFLMTTPLKMPTQGLYAITDSKLLPTDTLLIQVESALKGGAKLLQYRDKQLKPAQRKQQAIALKTLCHQYHVPLLINDDLHLADEIQADGVHLGKQDASLQEARQLLGANAIIGISCYQQLDNALTMQQQGATYIAFGRFFPSKTKPDASPAPIALLNQAREQIKIPIIAIGGITIDNGKQLIQAGADMLAVINNLFGDVEQIQTKAQHYNQLFT